MILILMKKTLIKIEKSLMINNVKQIILNNNSVIQTQEFVEPKVMPLQNNFQINSKNLQIISQIFTLWHQ